MRRRILFSAIVWLVSLGASLAATVTAAETVEYGIFDKVSIGSRKEPGVLTGEIEEVPAVKLKERTTIIPAVLGTSFGMTLKLKGTPAGERVNCWIRWIHPKLTNPISNQSSEREESPSRYPIGEVISTGYTLGHSWELVPGTWTVQVFWDWKLVAEKTFEVIPPH